MSNVVYTITSLELGSASDAATGQQWTRVGTFAGADGPTRNVLDISPYRSQDVAFRFTAHGALVMAPQITRFEVEYMPVGTVLRQVQTRVFVGDSIETPQGIQQVEHSAAFIKATLFSCAASRLPYTVQFPEPAPAAWTMRARITLIAPGMIFPMLAYDGNVNEGDVTVRFEEL